MKSLLLASGLLALGCPAAAIELNPQRTYVATSTFLGAAGGMVLGAALGGLSRPAGADRVSPFLRWGGMGALFGGVLGRQIGLELVSQTQDLGDARAPSSRAAGACLGALLGEAVGFGLSVAVAESVSRDSKEIWAGISLGAIVGASAGFLVRPLAFLAPPLARSRRQPPRAQVLAGARIEPLGAMPFEATELIRETTPLMPGNTQKIVTPPASQFQALNYALLETEEEQLLARVPAPFQPFERTIFLPSLSVPPQITALAKSVVNLGLLEGALLGGSIGGSLSGDPAIFNERVVFGSVLGMLAGFSATSSLARPWKKTGDDGFMDIGDSLEQGGRVSGFLVGGLIGTVIGAAVGATLTNTVAGFDRTDMARSTLAGNAAGLLIVYLFTASRE